MKSGKRKTKWFTVMSEKQIKKDVSFEGQRNTLTLGSSISAQGAMTSFVSADKMQCTVIVEAETGELVSGELYENSSRRGLGITCEKIGKWQIQSFSLLQREGNGDSG